MPGASAVELEPYRFTRAQYDRMVDAGVLEDLPVELLDGVIVGMSPQGDAHVATVQVLTAVLAPVAADIRLRVQGPIAASDRSEPEPDLAITSLGLRDHPETAELVIEVVVTARRQAWVKAPIYAAAGIPTSWIVDVPDRSVTVLEHPVAGRYERCRVLRGQDELEVPSYGIRTSVDDVLVRAGQ